MVGWYNYVDCICHINASSEVMWKLFEFKRTAYNKTIFLITHERKTWEICLIKCQRFYFCLMCMGKHGIALVPSQATIVHWLSKLMITNVTPWNGITHPLLNKLNVGLAKSLRKLMHGQVITSHGNPWAAISPQSHYLMKTILAISDIIVNVTLTYCVFSGWWLTTVHMYSTCHKHFVIWSPDPCFIITIAVL